jgi:hypothetical protein
MQYLPVKEVVIPLCATLGNRMMLLLPVPWCHQTEYSKEAWSCSIPLDEACSLTGHMPFASLTLVADKVLGVHKDTRNMKGGATFVSIRNDSHEMTVDTW